MGDRRAQQVLMALSDLSPSSEQRRASRLRIPTEWFRWLPIGETRMFEPPVGGPPAFTPEPLRKLVGRGSLPDGSGATTRPASEGALIDRTLAERLAAVDQLRPEQRSIRAGWLFLAGRVPGPDGRPRRVFTPLVTVPVKVVRPALAPARLVTAGDVEVTELVTDEALRRELEGRVETGDRFLGERSLREAQLARLPRLRAFARETARAAGMPTTVILLQEDTPAELMKRDDLVIVAAVGVYAVHETGATSKAGSLRTWAEQDPSGPTAFHALYLPQDDEATADTGPVRSPYLLTQDQQAAVRRSRTAPVTLVSGAPGTGKSHTVAAIACDALARGQSVLVTAKADATVDALLDLFQRAPGPDPVVFGSNERRQALAERLSAGQSHPPDKEAVERARRAADDACLDADELEAEIRTALASEALLADDTALRRARRVAPGLFAGADLDAVEALLRETADEPRGWWAGRAHGRRTAALVAITGSDAPREALLEAVQQARAERAAQHLQAHGGLSTADDLARLAVLRSRARTATGDWLATDSRAEWRLRGGGLAAIGNLATALRGGRAARRALLASMDDRLTRALPLWVGSLPDIDDLLPPVAGLFDLVILDEASSLDQPLAAPALLRATRAVVAGDPRQLRHVSFLADGQSRAVLAQHGLDDDPVLASRLDVRRNSVFDVAAGVAPVLTMREHFRSHPHLVDFVAQRLYAGEVSVATRAPSTQDQDCVEVVRLEGVRDGGGVVRAEVTEVVSRLSALVRAGTRGVGVVTPFRAQADALEEAVLAAFTADEITGLDLRVGTVHAFQGNERDVVLVSLGVGATDGAMTWRFVEDPHLFTVLMTRARRRMVVIGSADPPAGGLVEGFLGQAATPPGAPSPAAPATPWVAALAQGLRLGGTEVLTGYPTGRHVLDLVAASRDVAVEAAVHPEGPVAHVERHLSLLESGWRVLDAYPSRWSDRQGELVVELLREL